MNQRHALLAAALAGLCATAATAAAPDSMSAKSDQERCYGIAKVGQNDCAAADGSHSCAGQAKVDKGGHDWKFVAKGSCAKAGGKLTPAK
jgi:uncharacterized membrane protein